MVTLVTGVLVVNHGFGLTQYRDAAGITWYAEQLRRELVDYLNQPTSPVSSIMIGDCGIVPLLFDQGKIIDSYCINNPVITAMTGSVSERYQQYNQWILANDPPDRIVTLALIDKNRLVPAPADKLLLREPLFHRDYLLDHEAYLVLPVKSTKKFGYRYQIYRRRQHAGRNPASLTSTVKHGIPHSHAKNLRHL